MVVLIVWINSNVLDIGVLLAFCPSRHFKTAPEMQETFSRLFLCHVSPARKPDDMKPLFKICN